jgi:hypothetical protein
MNSESAAVEQLLDGRMLLYKQPELLNHQAHGSLGLRRLERPFEFASSARVLPLTLGEARRNSECAKALPGDFFRSG